MTPTPAELDETRYKRETCKAVFESAQSACAEILKVKDKNPDSAGRIWQLSIAGKDCKAVLDPEWMNCMVRDGFTLKEGSCAPRQDFIFQPGPEVKP